MLTAWLVRYSMQGGNQISPKIENAITAFAAFPATVFHFFKPEAITDQRYITDSTSKPGLNYYTDTSKLSSGYFLISTFKKNKYLEIKLLDIRKDVVIKRWSVNPDTILHYNNPGELTENNIRLTAPLLLKDSSLIFNTDHSLIKINKASKVMWGIKKPFHHSVEYASDTSVWACSVVVNKKPFYVFTNKDTLDNCSITLVNAINGRIIFNKSIYDILNQNGYRYLMALGVFENDAFHLNEVNPAPSDTKYWKKGDLLISLRNKCTVFLYRPSTNKILWLKTGPWANEHDCSFLGNDRLMILGNDVIRGNKYVKFLYGHSNIYIYNFKTNTVDTPYTKIMARLKIRTYIEGRCAILPNGDAFFDETTGGKVYIFDQDKLKLTYCDRIDNKHIKMLNWVRYIPKPVY
jgi:hypothetical protein